MTRYTSFAITLSLLALFRTLAPLERSPDDLRRLIALRDSFRDSESQLATGNRFSLRAASMWDLELISGVSDRLAAAIIDRRDQSEPWQNQDELSELLLSVRGVGQTTCEKLLTFLY